MKTFLVSLFVVLSLVVPVFAEEEPVWFTPLPGKEILLTAPGDPILVYAKLNNISSEPVTYVLAFIAGEKAIGSKVVTLSAYTAQDVSIQWKMPEARTEVIVTIARATDKNKKELKALAVPIGAVMVSLPEPKSEFTFGPIKEWVREMIDTLETFRIKKLEYFTRLKIEAKVVLSRTTLKDVDNLLQPETQTQSATDPTPQVEQKDNGTTLGYVKLAYVTIGKALFANKAVYFVIINIAILLIIRLVLKLLFR